MAQIWIDRSGKRFNPPSHITIDGIQYTHPITSRAEVVAHFGLQQIEDSKFYTVPENPELYYRTECELPPYVQYSLMAQEQIEQGYITKVTSALEAYYDSVAAVKNYDNRLTCALRAGMVGSPFQHEGVVFGVWMDNCNSYAYSQLAAVKEGKRSIPTPEELIAELPAPPWLL